MPIDLQYEKVAKNHPQNMPYVSFNPNYDICILSIKLSTLFLCCIPIKELY